MKEVVVVAIILSTFPIDIQGTSAVVDNCRNLVTQCAISTFGNACSYLNCILEVAINLNQCPRNSPYRATMTSLTRSLSKTCYTHIG